MNKHSLLSVGVLIGALWASGAAAITYTSTDTPKPIPDLATTTSVISIGDSYSITDLNVQVNLTHPFDGDLDLILIAPNSTEIDLSLNRGDGGDNFANTIFDDEAATPIGAGTPPFAGSFRPDEVLSTLDGLSISGDWTLRIVDEFQFDFGTLLSWSIIAQEQTTTAIPEPTAVLLFGSGLVGLRLIRRRAAFRPRLA